MLGILDEVLPELEGMLLSLLPCRTPMELRTLAFNRSQQALSWAYLRCQVHFLIKLIKQNAQWAEASNYLDYTNFEQLSPINVVQFWKSSFAWC